MNVIAKATLTALAGNGVSGLPAYRRALVSACDALPPVFGKKRFGERYHRGARDPEWVARSLALAAQGEGDGAEHLWDLAACTPDADLASQIKRHAIDEARHSRAYITLLELIFPGCVDDQLRPLLQQLSPGYTKTSPLAPTKGSPYAIPATVDELIQMNLAEIRTRTVHLLQRPAFLAYCRADRRPRARRILDSLLLDETRHIAYTARLVERTARESGIERVMDLMRQRLKDFNEITDDEMAGKRFVAA